MEDNIFEFQFTEDDDIGVFTIALVSSPANETEMIHFSKDEKVEWKMASEEKHILVAPVLIPNQKVYRQNIQGQEGYVFASELTIEKLQQNFSKQQYGNTSNLEHEIPVDGVYVSETWLIEDPNNDKANALGFKNLPKGTWMVSMKVDNKEVWENYIKTNKLTGFSMEAILSTKKITNNKNQVKMNEEITEPVSIENIVENAIAEVEVPIVETEAVIEEEVVEMAADKSMSGDTAYEEVVPVEEVPAADTVPVEEVPVEEASVEELKNQIAVLEKTIADLEARNIELEALLVTKEEEGVLMSAQIPANAGILDVPMVDEAPAKGILGVLRKHKR